MACDSDENELGRLLASVRAPVETLIVLSGIALVTTVLAMLLLWNGID
jgi:hypothetical protein